MTHGTQGQQWIDDEIRKAEKMTDKVDISPEAVETRALCHDQFVGCDYDMTMTQDGHQKTASTLRAQAARIAELEAMQEVLMRGGKALQARAEAAEAKLAKAANGLTAIEKQYYMEASNPSPAFIRQIAAKMNGIARDTQDTLAELKGDNATPTTHRQRDRDFHRYVDGDIHDTAERYYKATLEAERNAVASLNRCLREKDAAMSTLFRLLDEHSIDYSHLIS